MADVKLTSETFTKAASSMLKHPVASPFTTHGGQQKSSQMDSWGLFMGQGVLPHQWSHQLHPVELPGHHHSLHNALPGSPPLRIAHISFLAKFPHHCANAIPGQPSPTKNTGKSVRLPGISSVYLVYLPGKPHFTGC